MIDLDNQGEVGLLLHSGEDCIWSVRFPWGVFLLFCLMIKVNGKLQQLSPDRVTNVLDPLRMKAWVTPLVKKFAEVLDAGGGNLWRVRGAFSECARIS